MYTLDGICIRSSIVSIINTMLLNTLCVCFDDDDDDDESSCCLSLDIANWMGRTT